MARKSVAAQSNRNQRGDEHLKADSDDRPYQPKLSRINFRTARYADERTETHEYTSDFRDGR